MSIAIRSRISTFTSLSEAFYCYELRDPLINSSTNKLTVRTRLYADAAPLKSVTNRPVFPRHSEHLEQASFLTSIIYSALIVSSLRDVRLINTTNMVQCPPTRIV